MLLVISGGGGVNDQLGRFLTDNGLGHLKESFVEQEVEVRQLVGMSDQNLMELRGENYRCQNFYSESTRNCLHILKGTFEKLLNINI